MEDSPGVSPGQWQRIKDQFQAIWGYDDFRPPQGQIVETLVTGRDALVVMPTGGGKSICFQLPALLRSGLTLVISPLVALMENQVQELQERQLPAATLHSQLPRRDRQRILKELQNQRLRLLYVSPETLLSPPVWSILVQSEVQISGLILDEAHCLVQWGESFRPSYGRLGAVRSTLLRHKPPGTKIAIAAFTATADPLTRKVLQESLQLHHPQTFFLNPYRPNLNLRVKTIWTPRGRRQSLMDFLRGQGQQCGLVYGRSRRDCETLSQQLQNLGFRCEPYHGGLGATQRRQLEQQWLEDKLQFVVCTSAFGMGINKADVRWVVHFQAPGLLSEYIQEVGRGGRDGQPCEALTLVSEKTGWLNPADKQRQKFLLAQLKKQYRQGEAMAQQLPRRGHLQDLLGRYPQGELGLILLARLGRLRWEDPFTFRLNPSDRPVSFQSLIQEQTKQQQLTQEFFHGRHCRWQFLLRAFGFAKSAQGFNCGHCDRCLSQS